MDLQKEMKQLQETHSQVDWKLIRHILSGIADSLKVVCDMLPAGLVKNIICGVASIILIICHQLPE